MRLSTRKRSNMMAMNMTPMIDIVFLLLIFFMTVTHVARINNEQLDLPKQQGTKEQTSSPVTINVNDKGEIVVSGSRVSLPEMVAMLKKQAVEHGSASYLSIVLRADRRGTSRAVNQIVNALSSLGITRMRMAVDASH